MRVRSLAFGAILVVCSVWLVAQTLTPVLPNCVVTGANRAYYGDGDWRVIIRCETNGTATPVAGDRASVSRVAVVAVAPAISSFTASPTSISLGQSVTFSWSVTGSPTPTLSINQGIGAVTGTSRTVTPTATGSLVYTLTATNSAGSATRSVTVTVSSVVPPPTTGIYGGAVDPLILGNCTAARHDTYVTTRDGIVFRTWHPQVDPTGCIYAHEHGDNPTRLTDASASLPAPAFGYILSKTPGHPAEPHEGYKIFIENPGAVNDEDRVNRIYSRSVFHMGTGGPARVSQPHHSAEIYVRHPEFGLMAHTQLMMDTGGHGIVCDPRSPAPNKDVVAIDFVQRCGGKKLGSLYEIWSTEQSVRAPGGREVYRSFATPALFDPITAFNPANPSEVIYIGGTIDPRVVAIMAYPSDTWWANSRGCDRESYAQPGYWYNQGGTTTYYTNSLGQSLAASDPLALVQRISAHNSIGAPATNDGLGAFKSRPHRWCGNIAQLKLKN